MYFIINTCKQMSIVYLHNWMESPVTEESLEIVYL